MRNGSRHSKLHIENVEKVIRNLQRVGRQVNAVDALQIGYELIKKDYDYRSSTEACEFFSCEIWNMGLVT